MAIRGLGLVLVAALIAAVFSSRASAQSTCRSAIVGLAPCLGYIAGNSPSPSTQCCSQLSNLVQSQAPCLCTFLKGQVPIGISVNQTLALNLPGLCRVQTPPMNLCDGIVTGGPATSPVGAPGPSLLTPPPVAGGPTSSVPGTGTKTGESSSASSIKAGFSFFFLLFAASAIFSL